MELDDLFARANELPSIPEVIQDLIKHFDDENVDADDIAERLSMDQMLTAKILRLANSARYGRSRSVSSVHEALVRLGFNQVRTLVLASSFTSAFKAPEGFDIKRFWQQSFAVAELCRWLARFTDRVDGETAFTCGMVASIGRLLTHTSLAEKAQEIDRVVAQGGNRHDMEMAAWGFTSDEAGARVATHWKFPESIVNGVKYQYGPWETDEENSLACIVYIAINLDAGKNAGKSQEELIVNFPNDVARAVAIDLSRVLDSLDDIHHLESGIEALLN